MPLNWASSLDQLWQTPGLGSALAIGAVLFFAFVLIVVALRASRTVANSALVVIALASTASMAFTQYWGPQSTDTQLVAASRSAPPSSSVAALACLDGMAGEGVEAACERTLFSSPDMTAAAVSYTAAQLSRLTPADALTSKSQTADGTTLRRTLERDRYGLVAQVLIVRDGCTPSDCPVFKIFSDSSRVIANMNGRTYESTIGRYALAWAGAGTTSASSASPLPVPTLAATASVPPAPNPATPSRPSNIDFPSAASTPPVNIMIGEVPSSPTLPSARPVAAAAPNPQPKQAPKKQVAAKPKAAPVQLAPQPDGGDEEN